ncbi:trehalose-phosphatase [Parvularcula lutaonensis]|uniref:Trehalose 6-phosphate phosphatase n=1 Tax=Parvularcula lutaonensis TaxID=491923 RepID=A0ABV7MDI1_9PROT|nr:trehalose-phosphatase [Parvularcula lutaonensis]GGY49271.1 trehalose 6-phosphate phosphatase [Parvularcula lutaonensis]
MRGILNRETALFLDFDGTLVPIQDDPDAVHLPDGGAAIIESLAERLSGALAMVSGRDGRDLSKRVPTSVWRAGNHGDMLLPPGSTKPSHVEGPTAELLERARQIAATHEGVVLEEKARVLTLHTRQCRQHEASVAKALEELVAGIDGYKLQRGKDVAELKPAGVHKGIAIERLLDEDAFRGRKPLFLGDDTTDEDGFRVCLDRGGSAIKVGDGETLAPHRLADHHDVWRFLKEALDDLS